MVNVGVFRTAWMEERVSSEGADRPGDILTASISRRTALRTGGAALAASALAAAGLQRPTIGQAAVESPESATWQQPQTETSGAGGVEAALAQLDGVVTDIMSRTGVPGIAVTVVHEDQVAYLKGFGVREAGTNLLVSPDTVFQIASLSKAVSSTVVSAIVGDGLVSWNTRLSDLTPEIELYGPYPTREVTLLDLFTHRSGLPDHVGDLLEDMGYDRVTILHRLRYAPPTSSFRAGYAYTNFGLAAAAFAAATTTGMTWEDLAQERLYSRAGMTRTSSKYAGYLAHENRALLHQEVDGAWVSLHTRDNDAASPAGGVSSTVRDMARWLRLQLGNGTLDGEEIVNAETLADSHRPWTLTSRQGLPQDGRVGFYGLGWNVGSNDMGQFQLSHSGAFYLGAATNVFVVPALQLGIVVLTNGWPVGAAEAISLSFLDLVNYGEVRFDYLSILGPLVIAATLPPYPTGIDYTTPPDGAMPPLAWSAYAGHYENSFFGPLEVAVEDDALVLRYGPAPESFDMIHYDRDVFAYQPRGENASAMSAATFTIGDEGYATKLDIDYFAVDGVGTPTGLGVFTRMVEE